MQDEDLVFELGKAMRALNRIKKRVLQARAKARRVAEKAQERAELQAIAEDARRRDAQAIDESTQQLEDVHEVRLEVAPEEFQP